MSTTNRKARRKKPTIRSIAKTLTAAAVEIGAATVIEKNT